MAIATVSRFYLRDSHVALLLGMTFEAVAITSALFEQCSATHILAAVAARVPSLKLHIPFIRTP